MIEISNDDGANWTDLGPEHHLGRLRRPGSRREARWAAGTRGPASARAIPALTTSVVNLGTTYAGQTVRVRFRKGTDYGTGLAGWSIGSLTVEGNQGPVFRRLVNDATPCALVAADEAPPRELDFALAGANPVQRSGALPLRAAAGRGRRGSRSTTSRAGASRCSPTAVTRRACTRSRGIPAAAGTRRSAGMYFARMIAGGRTLGQRVVVLD